ncbi:hypothetical protein DQQ10_11490 [Pseudochryseolinea flava]|uniref:Uncharacterized protein n=1 Tax=Pseudochryseolinea flava TaxID=2059302 RepID=A0A364Y264_9BACT|nr:hypothetical protein DQQ10_11490 [Pseudochryseolinea flava]
MDGSLSSLEQLSFERQLKNDPALRLNVFLQRKVYTLLKHYRRKNLKESARAVHDKLFDDPVNAGFKDSILRIFKS